MTTYIPGWMKTYSLVCLLLYTTKGPENLKITHVTDLFSGLPIDGGEWLEECGKGKSHDMRLQYKYSSLVIHYVMFS